MKNIHEENGVDRNVFIKHEKRFVIDFVNVTKFQKVRLFHFCNMYISTLINFLKFRNFYQ